MRSSRRKMKQGSAEQLAENERRCKWSATLAALARLGFEGRMNTDKTCGSIEQFIDSHYIRNPASFPGPGKSGRSLFFPYCPVISGSAGGRSCLLYTSPS